MNGRELEAAARRIFNDGRPLWESRPQELREVGFTDQFQSTGGVLAEARADRRQNRVNDVALLGRTSANNRIYTDRALRDAADLYDGVQLYLDHPTERELRDRDGIRSVRDLIGRAENTRVVGDRVRGDVVLLDVEPGKSLVLALAEQAPELAGFSHRARGTFRVDEDGRQIVENLDHVQAVELVSEPATVGGLQEALRQKRETVGRRGFRPVTDDVLEQASRNLIH